MHGHRVTTRRRQAKEMARIQNLSDLIPTVTLQRVTARRVEDKGKDETERKLHYSIFGRLDY